TFCQAAVLMKDRVEGILPPLVREAVFRLAMIFDETVAVAVAEMVDPGKRCLGVRPQGAHRLEVTGSPEILTEQQQEQGRRVDAPIVAAEWNLTQVGHFSMAHLVQNLSGLSLAFRPRRDSLRGGKKSEHPPRDGGIEPQSHQRRDDSVAAERCAEPRDA